MTCSIILSCLLPPPLGLKRSELDRIQRGGLIEVQVVDHILNDKIAVADCTTTNANVFYELALRHITGLPVIHLVQPNERMPFDAYDARAIPLDTRDLPTAMKARDAIEHQMSEMIEPGYAQPTPVRRAVAVRRLLSREIERDPAEGEASGLIIA